MAGQPITGLAVSNGGSFGFCFLLEANGGGTGTNPKDYLIYKPGNFDLKGQTDDNAPGVTPLWPSDPGDFPNQAFVQPPTRQYDVEVSPNNIRLSQVSIDSLTATHGIRPMPQQFSLPNSFGFSKDPSVPGNLIVGDLQGISKLTVSILGHEDYGVVFGGAERLLVNNSIVLGPLFAGLNQSHTFTETNLGQIQVVNLCQTRIVVGVHCEIYM